jgi:hypothetical protein
LPLSGVISPLMMRSSVVLPAPFGPTIVTVSPRANFALTPVNSTSVYDFSTLTSSIAMPVVALRAAVSATEIERRSFFGPSMISARSSAFSRLRTCE